MRTNWGCDFFVVLLPQQCWDAQAPALPLPEPARSPRAEGPARRCDTFPERNFTSLPSLLSVSMNNSISCGDFLLIVCRANRGRLDVESRGPAVSCMPPFRVGRLPAALPSPLACPCETPHASPGLIQI